MLPRLNDRTLLYLSSCALCAILCFFIGAYSPSSALDFRARFYGARALLHGHDPYQDSVIVDELASDKTDPLRADPETRRFYCTALYPPPSLLILSPLAPLPWSLVHHLWFLLSIGGLALAGFLVLRTGLGSPHIAVFLACWVILNCETVLLLGNPATLAVATAIIAVWCLVEDRYTLPGTVLLAVSLALKPHNAGFLWLFLLLAGGAVRRRRALDSLVFCLLLAVPSMLWMTHVSSHWAREISDQLAAFSLPGSINDVGPDSTGFARVSPIVNLQSDLSLVWNNSTFYNSVTYALVGAMFLALVLFAHRIADLRLRLWIGLASVVPLEMLVSYHRTYDAKLLLLSIPACALLWQQGGLHRWLSAGLTGLALFLTADAPQTVILLFPPPAFDLHGPWYQRLAGILVDRPIPLVLLALAAFFVFVLVQQARTQAAPSTVRTAAEAAT